MEIALPVDVVVRRILSNISGCTEPIFATFHCMKALYVPMLDQYCIFEFVKGRCHGNQLESKIGQSPLWHCRSKIDRNILILISKYYIE